MLNAFPYTSGHLMVLPMRAVEQLTELDDTEHAELWHGVRLATQAIEAAYSPRESTSARTSAGERAPGFPTTCTCTSCPAGMATPTS